MFVDEHGNPIVDFGSIVGPTITDASQVPYVNSGHPGITNVGEALDQLLFVPMTVSMSGGGNFEWGTVLDSVSLTWSISKTIQTQLLSGPGAVQPAVSDRSAVCVGPFAGPASWSLLVTAADGEEQKTATAGISFFNRRYWGISPKATLDDADVQALSSEFSTGRAQSRTMNGLGQYLWFAWPAAWGAPTFIVNGLQNSAWEETIRSFTNTLGYSTSYRLYRSTYLQNGTGLQVLVQ